MASSVASCSRLGAEELPPVPSELNHDKRPSHVHHVNMSIPMPSRRLAEVLYRAISVDRVLKPDETAVSYCVRSATCSGASDTDVEFGFNIHAATIRILRLSINSVLENITLILETMQAFAPDFTRPEAHGTTDAASKAAATDQAASSALGALKLDETVTDVPPSEFELNGTGRAG